MKKQIVAMVTCLIMCSVFVLNGFTSHAVIGQGEDMLDFYVPYSRPEGDGIGYISFVVEQNGVHKLETFMWIVEPYDILDNTETEFVDASTWVSIAGNNVSIIIDNPSIAGQCTASLFTMYYSDSTGTRMDFLKSGLLSPYGGANASLRYTIDYSQYNMTILGYEIGGDCWLVNGSYLPTSLGGKFYYPRIHWNQEVGFEVYSDIMVYLSEMSHYTSFLPLIAIDSSATRDAVEDIRDSLAKQLDTLEQQKVDNFTSSSSTQTDELSSLNQQNQLDKPSVEDVSTHVDSALDFEIDSNYGLLLSSVTGHSRIVTMMLICSAIGLIAFVFFGKR